MTKGVILDTDPGVDDIVAIIYAIFTKINLLGITTVHGNSTIENVTQNARYIIDQLGKRNISIYSGTSESLTGRRLFAESSGYDGVSGFKVPRDYQSTSLNAVEFIGEQLRKNDSTDLLCLGPLTNIAVTFNIYPDLIKKVGKVIIMAGEFTGKGNITTHAEFNTYCDPHALQYVLDKCAEHGIDTVVIPANICRKVIMVRSDLDKLIEVTKIKSLMHIIKPYIDYYVSDINWGGYEGAVLYDLLVPSFYNNPENFVLVPAEIIVECSNADRLGQTILKEKKDSTIRVVVDIDGDKVKKDFLNTLQNGA